jgi:thymidylate kinase
VQAQLTKDRIELRSFEYHEDVRRKYLDQAKRDTARYRVINADRSIEDVHHDVLKTLRELK